MARGDLETGPPPAGTVERWCWELVSTRVLDEKLVAPRSRTGIVWEDDPPARVITEPGRPPELRVLPRSARTPRFGALDRPEARAALFHTFFHHELQATELFAWAILAFPDAPIEFRKRLFALIGEEIAHAKLYAAHLEHLGHRVGDFPVRDWFWQRGAQCESALAFVSFLGLGLEGVNLDYNRRFAETLREVGDERGAHILEKVEHDEVSHVATAIRWFEHFTGAPLDYDAWCEALPGPLTPALLQGQPLNLEARRKAGQSEAFLARLEAQKPVTTRRAK